MKSFQTKDTKVGILWRALERKLLTYLFYGHLVYVHPFLSILRPFDQFCGPLVYISPFWHFLPIKTWQPWGKRTSDLNETNEAFWRQKRTWQPCLIGATMHATYTHILPGIFASSAFFWKLHKCVDQILGLPLTVEVMQLIWQKMGWAILGDFLTNSSGHTLALTHVQRQEKTKFGIFHFFTFILQCLFLFASSNVCTYVHMRYFLLTEWPDWANFCPSDDS
jgi:hypothetical protein